MKKYLLGLLCAAVASTAGAQSPTYTQSNTPSVVVLSVGPGQPLPIRQVAGISYLSNTSCGPNCGPTCGPVCAAPVCHEPETKWICVSEPDVKKHTKFVYGSECTKICYPKCTLHCFLGCHDCGHGACDTGCASGCEGGKCEHHIYQKKYLIKYKCVTEEPINKCVAIEVPDCGHGHHGKVGGPGTGLLNNRGGYSAPYGPSYIETAPAPAPAAPVVPIGPPSKKMPAATTFAPASRVIQTQASSDSQIHSAPAVMALPPRQ